MFFYSTSLALLALSGFVLFMAVRLSLLPLTLRYAANAFQASISEQGKRIETLRAIQTIKVMSGEAQREGVWANRQAELVKAQQANGLAAAFLAAFQQLVETGITILIVYFAAQAVIKGDFTVGLLYAFVSYRQQFNARANALLDQVINWRMLEVYNTRIADVVLTPPETGIEAAPSSLAEIKGSVELAGACFRYGAGEPLIFQNISLSIAPGELVAIVGPSGCGKSTLVKAICGLYPLTSGDVRVDGLPLSIWGPKAIRSSIGAVLQNDELLPGSVLDNVTFFDEEPDVEWAWECLRNAAVADEIRHLPMAEHSYVGDLGGALSGGQRQRLLLARALYKRPRIVILDEATAHLDVDRERRINDYMKSLAVTRIIVAHRPDTVASADRVVMLRQNGIKEIGAGQDYRQFLNKPAGMHVVQM